MSGIPNNRRRLHFTLINGDIMKTLLALVIVISGCMPSYLADYYKKPAASEMTIVEIQKEFPGFSFSKAAQCKNGNPWKGMSKRMARLCLGNPYEINRTIGSYGTHEQWVYNALYTSAMYVYFDNGKLTTIQN